jgi:acetate kinase
MNILVLNAGSSSFNASLYRSTENNLPLNSTAPLWTGKIDWKSPELSIISAKNTNDISAEAERVGADKQDIIQDLLNLLWSGETKVIEGIGAIDIVGHRVVYGGDKYRKPTLINGD